MGRPRTGSVRWKDGAWRLQVSVGEDHTGRRRFRSQTVHAPNTKQGREIADQALATLLLEVRAGIHAPAERGSFAELVDQWIKARSPDWSPGAAKHTRQVLSRHVLPHLGARRVETIKPVDIEALYGRLRGQLSASTVRRIHNYVRSAFSQAVRWQMIDRNPAAQVEPPRVPRVAPHRIPDPAAVRAALDAAPPVLACLLRLAVHTGARRGELVRLRWSDVDLAAGAIVFHQTKTDSWKTVSLGPATKTVFEQHRRHVAEQALALGRSMPDWVFPSWRHEGKHLGPDTVTHSWAKLREAVGLDSVRLHDLRHTMATQLISTGTDLTTVQGRGGWSSPQVLLGTYSHRVSDADRRAAEAMDDWLEAGAG